MGSDCYRITKGARAMTANTVPDDNEVLEEYGLVDVEGNLLNVVHVASSNQYELHPIPYSGSYNDKLVGDWTTDDIDTFVEVYKGDGDGTLWWPKLSNTEARPVRIVTELNPKGPVCKKVEYHLLELPRSDSNG
jgi:hypothetical protein